MKLSLFKRLVALFAMAFAALPAAANDKPNFLIIVADDFGWSDPGFLGSSIRTPNIDALAERGIFLSNFYVAPTCSPTRAMLLTGVGNHAAGLGTMQGLQASNQIGHREYAAQLHDGVVTLAEVLRANGYATSMAGKWHLAIDEDQYPNRRGFERSFGLLPGGASHFADRRKIHRTEEIEYLENGKPVDLPPDFYSTYAYSDKIIEYINASEDKPFFAYLAYTAPHDPLQVPDDWLDRYAGAFDKGPAFAKQRRAERLIEMGLIDRETPLEQPQNFPKWLDSYKEPWSERDEQERAIDARRMEIYAAMVEIMDQQIGRVITHLEQSGKLDNTYVIFMSDNGASAGTRYTYPNNSRAWIGENYDLSLDAMGEPGSFTTMGREWTNNSNTPFRYFKVTVGEGGVRSPFVISGPELSKKIVQNTPAHVMDIAPTIFDLADIIPAEQDIYDGKLMPRGQSLLSVFNGDNVDANRTIVTELFGSRMVRRGNWKAMLQNKPLGSGEWELFDIVKDPSATNNLASTHPELLTELRAAYDAFAKENNLIAPETRLNPQLITLYEGPCDGWCEAKFTLAQTLIDPVKRTILIVGLLGVVVLIGALIIRRRRRRLRSQ